MRDSRWKRRCRTGWHRYVGDGGDVIGVERFGASAPGNVVMEKLGFTVEHVVERATRAVGKINMRIAIGADHAGFELKQILAERFAPAADTR